ncbi:phosphoribosylglycinamide formyltransferase [Candidatus Micrarchaeota archaeon]|nr:phosphoribosylglycinamide formyltransferase [Candidatus Micrarchaeota archaeon]
MAKINIAVLASGRGSNFKSIVDEINAGRCDAEVKVLVTNNPEALAITTAQSNGIPVEVLQRKQFASREEMDTRIKETLDRYGAELVVLAGYMLILKGKDLLESYKNKIINIHPALLPAFPGADAQAQAYEYGVKISGVTIHFVDKSLDAGPIIYQEAVDVSGCRGPEDVAARILEIEHKAYPKVVDTFSRGRYVVEGRRTRFVKEN